ncbi:MAG: hypothetical protein ACXAEU_14495 [Candidatus Hodarchaeales archaeon]
MALDAEELKQAITDKLKEASDMELKDADLEPLSKSIAEAVVEHLKASATITGTDVGTDWRIE